MEFAISLTVDKQHLAECLRGILWTIFFHRAMGSIVPETQEFLDVPYVSISEMR